MKRTRSKAQRAQFEVLVRAGTKDGLAARQARSLARRRGGVSLARIRAASARGGA